MPTSLCPNCRRLEADPATVHNRGRVLLLRRSADDPAAGEYRVYTCRNCGALWNLSFTARSPRVPLPAERWSLRQSMPPRESA